MSSENTRSHIAIVGMAGRFPGADSVDELWRNLCDGMEAITFFSDEELLSSGVRPEILRDPRYVKAAPVLNNVDQFDAGFFQYSPREAALMDPQQRLFLECAWEALEDAACDPYRFPGSIGLYASQGPNVASYFHAHADAFREYLGQSGSVGHIGNDKDYLTTRASFKLNLRGPSIAVQTACSSSLVAVHLACQSLLARECDAALAGGVSIRIPHRVGYLAEEGNIRSHDGHCRVFDAQASGTVFGSGVALVVLKPLSDALNAGDRIYAVIRGSAVNNDGSDKLSYTVTSVPQQTEVIAEALAIAGTPPETIGYVEAHGTATVVGDPLEFQALTRAFGNRAPPGSCALGSVKANVGHLEIAAGVTGLIKAALALYHRKRPPTILFERPNLRIDFASSPFRVEKELTPWESGPHPRRACVNSLGIGGTNAHVVLEEAPPARSGGVTAPERTAHVLPLSGKSIDALRELAGRYKTWLEAHPESSLADVCHTAGVGRSHLDQRAALVAESSGQMQAALHKLQQGQTCPGLFLGQSSKAKVAWLFTGQGSQYLGMARQLYDSQPLFRAVLDQSAAALADELPQPLLDVLFGTGTSDNGQGPLLNQTQYTQPALFTVEVALARLYQSWGVQPDVVLGHSVGEYAAACVAGVFTLENGLRLIARRGLLMGDLPRGGAMAAIFADGATIERAMVGMDVSIAAFNGSHNVISGPREQVDLLVQHFERKGVRCNKLQTSHAFHSALIEPSLDAFERVAASIDYQPAQWALISNLTGQPLDANEVLDAAYWRHHAREPVQFARSVQTLEELGCGVLLEIGPHPVLTGMAASCWRGESSPATIASLRRGAADSHQICQAVAQLYVHGVTPDFAGFDGPWPRRKLSLPTYPFQRQRHWVDVHSAARSPGAMSDTLRLLSEGDLEQLQRALPFWDDLDPDQAEVATRVLETLCGQHEAEQATTSIRQHLYRITWQPAEAVAPVSWHGGHWWLILADRKGVGRQLAARLEDQGQQCRLLYLGDDAVTTSDTFQAVLSELDREATPLAGVFHLWSLDLPAVTNLEVLAQMRRLALESTLHLVQAMLRQRVTVPVQYVTRAAQATADGDAVAPQQTALWGMGKVLGLEHPELFGKLIDLPASDDGPVLDALQHELLSNDHEDQVALRRGQRLVARLQRVDQLPASKPLKLLPDASYLITGGLGALGLKTAKWLAEHSAGHVVLTSRHAPGDERQRQIDRITQHTSCKVHVRQADVSDSEQVQALLASISTELPPLRGVVHAAGIEGRESLAEMSSERLDAVLRAKTHGGWLLHEATRGLGLDLFVSFSSIASVWGSQGQAHYAAANALLDGLTQSRRSQGLAATSVNFGPWTGGGMADRDFRQRLERVGVRALSPARALAGLASALAHPSHQLVVADIEWPTFLAVMQARGHRRFLAALQTEGGLGGLSGGKTSLVERLERAPASQCRAILRDHIRNLVAQILHLEVAAVDESAGFFDLGMDSLMAVELRRRLSGDIGSSLPATLAMDRPTIAAAVTYLLDDVLHLETYERAAAHDDNRDVHDEAAELLDLDDVQVDAMLSNRLRELLGSLDR